jgi:hypothetical protein
MIEKKSARRKPSKAAKLAPMESSAEEATRSPVAASEPSGPFEGKIYITGSWKGLPNYACMFCGFATINHQTALEHAAEAHSPPEKEIVDTGLVTKDGVPITRARQPKED